MKQLKQAIVTKLKARGCEVGKVDYTANTKYYRVADSDGESLFASVDPRIAARAMVGYIGSTLWEITL